MMTRLTIAGAVVAAALVAAAASIQGQGDPPMYTFGVGRATCADWNTGRNQPEFFVYASWVNGFLSGVSFVGGQIRPVDGNAIEQWMDNYCRNNPLVSLRNASVQLALELRAIP